MDSNNNSSSGGVGERKQKINYKMSNPPPLAIPIANNDNSQEEYTPLMKSSSNLSKSSSPTKRQLLHACKPSTDSPWHTNDYLHSSSPMVSSGARNIRLPNLDLREARRQSAMQAANNRLRSLKSSEFQSDDNLKRSRSKSLGSEKDKLLLDGSQHSSPLLLGESLLKRRTPSGLSLLDIGGDINGDEMLPSSHDDIESSGYGAIESTTADTGVIYTKPLEETTQETAKPITKSQSCTVNPTQQQSTTPPPVKIDADDILLQELKAEFESQSNPPILSLLYGLVNTSIILPVLMSFGSIIYHDEFFRPYLSVLMKLTVVSGAIHQITFSTVSSLPFAVGQVQDAGLIFLSSMARDLVSRLQDKSVDDMSILATVTIGLSLYTAALGCALILVGKFKLASYCQLLPPSVVGGYLAFIGFFCGQAGLALMASVNVTGLSQWYKFFNADALILLTPGVVGGCFIYYSVRTFRHMSVLPTCIVMLMVVFYVILFATDSNIQEATENGWINETAQTGAWYHMWDFLRLDKVVWSVLPSQTLTVIAMISVVALSSSLDIAAIEIELKRPLDYNHELKTVGISNIISGMTGGYTGSYIFSQTIFSLRMGIRSRVMGYLVAAVSLISVVVPFNILAYIPNFFFGSLLMMIALDLMFEWLIDVREKVTNAEYFILIGTFVLLQILGVEFGIIGGCLLYVALKKMGYDLGKEEQIIEDEKDLTMATYQTPIQTRP